MSRSSLIPSMTQTDVLYGGRNNPNISPSRSPRRNNLSIPTPSQAYLYQSSNRRPPSDRTGDWICGSPAPSDSSNSSIGSRLKQNYPQQTYYSSSHLEKGYMDPSSAYNSPRRPQSHNRAIRLNTAQSDMVEDNVSVLKYIHDQDALGGEERDDHAIGILMWLSLLDPMYCLFGAVSSLCVVFALLVISPIQLCRSNYSFNTSLIRMITPIFRKHLRIIHAPSVERAHTFEFGALSLVLIYLASPLLSIGVAAASWIAGAFWLFSIIMGNPDGSERKDDGRTTVLMVRNWWEKYLLNATRH